MEKRKYDEKGRKQGNMRKPDKKYIKGKKKKIERKR